MGFRHVFEPPVEVSANPSTTNLETILRRYSDDGYAKFASQLPPVEAVLTLARSLRLGKPMIPSHNSDLPNYERGLNWIRASIIPEHRGFGSRQAQGLHSDGTLSEVGEIRSVILFCVTEAALGGETTLFRASDAYAHLLEEVPMIVQCLQNESVFTRRDVGRSGRESRGPVFRLEGHRIASRFSMDNTVDWRRIRTNPEVKMAFDQLLGLVTARDPRFFVRFRLKAGEGVLLANASVSHGRTKYFDSVDRPRAMLRGLFKREPS